jgi:hypothetical protein
MEENKEVFRFEDFLNGSKIDHLIKMKQSLLEEGVFDDVEYSEEEEYEDIDQSMNPYRISESFDSESTEELIPSDEVIEYDHQEEYSMEESKSESEGYYKLFKDKAEEFVCDIAVEGVNQSDTEVRLIIESEDWTLMFVGEINKGKCIIPIKKLNILSEGQIGKIRLEVNADGNLFTPWEDKFVVKASKKVTVKVNESRYSDEKISKKQPGVKIRFDKARK